VSAAGDSSPAADTARVVARRRDGFVHEVETDRGHRLILDEPPEKGGADEGPSPTRTLGAALAACTAITAEMYAERKGWDLAALEVEVEITFDGPVPTVFDVTLRCPGELDDDQLDRLRRVAAKCPVHKALAHESAVKVNDRVERC
jgi:putative redox protein